MINAIKIKNFIKQLKQAFLSKLVLIGFLGVSLFSASPVSGSHYLGGDITWKCLGNDSFAITLTLWRDCGGQAFSNPKLQLNCAQNGDSIIYTTNYQSGTCIQATPVCDTQCTPCTTNCNSGNTNTGCSFGYGFEKIQYIYIVDLSSTPNNCCGISMSFSSLFRNSSNTTLSGTNKVYLEAFMNQCQAPCNNSPEFAGSPVQLNCVSNQQSIFLGGYDTDTTSQGNLSDSLVYELTSPKTSQSSNVTYSSAFSYDKPLTFSGFPNASNPLPKGFHLSQTTGLLQYMPTKQENGVTSVKIKEYRNGTLISEITRDITLMAANCPSNAPPVISGINGKDTFRFDLCSGHPYCFRIFTNDSNLSDTVSLKWDPGNLNGATFKLLDSGSRPVLQVCWKPTASKTGALPYSFSVTAKDDACPIPGKTTRVYRFKVHPGYGVNYNDSILACNKARFSVNATGKDTFSYRWALRGIADTITDTFVHHFKDTGTFPYTLYVSNNRCTRTFRDSIRIDTVPNYTLTADTLLCESDSIRLNATGGNSYSWKPSRGLSDPGISNPMAKPDTTTHYRVTIRYLNACEVTDTVSLRVVQKPEYQYSITNPSCNLVQLRFSGLQEPGWNQRWLFRQDTLQGDLDSFLFDTGSIPVHLEVFNSKCTFTASKTLKLDSIPLVSIPLDTLYICRGDSIPIPASGLDTFIWKPKQGLDNPSSASPKVFAQNTTQYHLQSFSSDNTCFDRDSIVVYVDSACVWPGDANHDGAANNIDVLSIGLSYLTKGPKRPGAIRGWKAQPALSWDSVFNDLTNFKHSDCNGDGVVDASDLIPLDTNYSQTHQKKGAGKKGGPNDPPLLIKFDKDSVSAQDTLTGEIIYGTVTKQAKSVYGIAFTINFDQSLVDSGKVFIQFDSSWFGNPSNTIFLVKGNYQSGKVEVGYSRINQQPVSGFGKIGSVGIVPIDNVIGKKEVSRAFSMHFSNVKAIDTRMNQKAVNEQGDTAIITGLKVGKAEEKEKPSLMLYPNPVNSVLYISSTETTIRSIQVFDMLGEQVLKKSWLPRRKKKIQVDCQSLKPGIYNITILTRDGLLTRRFSIAVSP